MSKRQPVTIRDVAEQAGVSLMTVSAVLNGKSAERRISEVTQGRVREIARLLDYRPNAVARSLRRKSTNVIGLYSGIGYLNASHPFLAELIGGLQEGCDQHQKDLLLHGTFRGLSVDDIYAELVNGRLDGLIVQAPPSDPLVDRLAASHLPVIAVVDAIASIPSVVADDAAGTRMLVDYLAGQGHRRLLYLSPSTPIVSACRRRMALYESASSHGLDVVELSPHRLHDLDGSLAETCLRAPRGEWPTAVICWADSAAYDFMAYCQSHGVRVPDDVAVTGFDGFPMPAAAVRRLTTIRAPWGEVARTAVRLLTELHKGRDLPRETVIPVEFVQGDTA